ncbi:MFS transporter [Thermomicrobium sp. 4228-Ro]|uniref:MFS transporter n=1 Tax=Thermomicrobium sp. 4228-Ro TaxID=2993937 RepID=UPI002248F370|nr:MFS transporter [Thermomicrobium sp. 4228-Ro]MCX2727832.1 MFS transporter [Thermomicrobium sp. 4228-Ro]
MVDGSRSNDPHHGSTETTSTTQVLAASWLAYATFYFPRLAFSASKLGLLADPSLALSRAFLGFADALFLAVYAAGQFVSGAVTERLGPRRLVSFGLLLAAAAALALAVVRHPWLLVATLVVQGIAQSTGWAAVCADVASHTPVERRGTAFGVLSTSYAFGALAAPVVLGWIAYAVAGSWRAAPLASAVVAALVTTIYLRWLGLRHRRTRSVTTGASAGWSDVLRQPAVWLLSVADFLLKPVIYATVFWAPVLVHDAIPTLDPALATTLAGVLGLAGLAGPLLAGTVSDRLFASRRAFPALLALLGCSLTLVLYPVAARTGRWWLLALVLLALGVTLYAAESLIVGVASAEAGRAHSALAVGIVNGVGSFGGIIGGFVPGLASGSGLFLLLAAATLVATVPLVPVARQERSAAVTTVSATPHRQ